MAHLVGLVVSEDDTFRKHIGRMLRSGSIPVSVVDNRELRDGAAAPDLLVVDIRGDVPGALATIERLRSGAPHSGIFAIATTADPDLILQSMRARGDEVFLLGAAGANLP